jgi:hypothetical protein
VNFDVGKGCSISDSLFFILDLQLGNWGSGMGHRSTKSNTVKTLQHEKTIDRQPDLFAHVNGPEGDDSMTEFDQDGSSCAKWLHELILSREVLQ